MSLFRFKDWWNVQAASNEDFGHYSMCVANIDNSINGSDKLIVGSFSGILRIFSVGFKPTEEGLPPFQASDLLMEMDFKTPILQVSSGLLLSATTNIQLAVLHPKKLSIYSISSTAGVTEHGSAYNILLIYEHSLQRSAFNMTLGPFGHVRGKDFLCVQSLDGNLSFFEQESLAFNRFIPNSLLPGPIAYVPNSDSFVVATSQWTVESYRYQVLAIANNEEDGSTNSVNLKGRKVTSDWSLSLGESVIDIKVVSLEKSTYFLIVLGERNLFALKENGGIWFMKKLDFNPSCLTAYPNDTNDSVISLIATHISTLIIYCNDRAMWATQLPFSPVCIQRAFFPNLTGALCCLSDEGLVCCGYLGTNPSIKIVSVPTSQAVNQINYSESEAELQELRTIINLHNLEANRVETKVRKNALTINVIDVQTMSSMTAQISNPMFKVCIQLQSTSNVSNVRMAVEMHKSLVAEPNILVIPSISNTSESAINEIIIYKDNHLFPASTRVNLIVTYTNEDGAPRLSSKSIHMPINIFAKLGLPSKDVENKLNLEIVNNGQPISLLEIFSDLLSNDSTSTTAIGLEIYDDHNSVSISTSIKSVNQKFIIQSDSFASMAFIANEFIRRLAKNNVKYDISNKDISFLPLNKVFAFMDQHLLARHKVLDLQNGLASSATQFRAIQKRLLIKLKDRNPTPLNNLETLLKVSQTQINGFAEKLVKAVNELNNRKSYLSSSLILIYNLIVITTELKSNSIQNIHSIFTHYISNDLDEGWEERTELCLITLLDSYGKEISNATKISGELAIPETSDDIKRLIKLLISRLLNGENLNNRETNANHKSFLSNDTIAEEEENNS